MNNIDKLEIVDDANSEVEGCPFLKGMELSPELERKLKQALQPQKCTDSLVNLLFDEVMIWIDKIMGWEGDTDSDLYMEIKTNLFNSSYSVVFDFIEMAKVIILGAYKCPLHLSKVQ